MQAETERDMVKQGSVSCVRTEKAGQSDVRRLPALLESEIFGAAIQDSGSRLRRGVDWLGGGGVGGRG